MSKPSQRTIEKEKKRLRAFIDDKDSDPLEVRFAYAVEGIISWITQDTEGWEKPLEWARSIAEIAKQDSSRFSERVKRR